MTTTEEIHFLRRRALDPGRGLEHLKNSDRSPPPSSGGTNKGNGSNRKKNEKKNLEEIRAPAPELLRCWVGSLRWVPLPLPRNLKKKVSKTNPVHDGGRMADACGLRPPQVCLPSSRPKKSININVRHFIKSTKFRNTPPRKAESMTNRIPARLGGISQMDAPAPAP